MTKSRWYIGGGGESVIVEGETSNFPNTTTGETTTFDFYIRASEIDSRQPTGGTYGGPETWVSSDGYGSTGYGSDPYGGDTSDQPATLGGTYGGPLGMTYGGGSLEFKTAEERYNRLKEYLRYAGYATTSKTLGSAYFTEPLDFANADVDTLLVPIYPHEDIDQARGVWGVITGGDDTTEIFGAIARVSISVFVLAEYSEYDSEQAVRDEFESPL